VSGTGAEAAMECLKCWKAAGATARIVIPKTAGTDIADYVANRRVK
jgi:hypothetical protein